MTDVELPLAATRARSSSGVAEQLGQYRRELIGYCSFTKAIEHLGDRWSLFILRALAMLGPQGFNELATGLPGRISRSVLADRLRKLENLGLVAHAGRVQAARRVDPAREAHALEHRVEVGAPAVAGDAEPDARVTQLAQHLGDARQRRGRAVAQRAVLLLDAALHDVVARRHKFQKVGRKGEVRYGYAAAIVGGGSRLIRPGAAVRASHGVLFLDESTGKKIANVTHRI